ncbi:1,4-dihydroxy-6-naphthoate synthase [Clostridium manihotivorum]|uniref:1,4-dihydroxy-6-naphthoate synthase n=1 Tax=Clostridium manihotivorum TaxID=2320868 RepID=A0A3R5UA70_9CLOT|nr:1,4-dihydroxy-6-naphthoate synthase [Clostridium manihotivorum]QAA33369.1 1,4-dihydroxy-6-naphthoate synthase [Clostridium manihotivorum]
MNIYDNLYCKIYVDTDKSIQDIINVILSVVSGQVRRKGVYSTNLEIDIRYNKEYDELERLGVEDGFLYYKYYLEIEPNENAAQKKYILSVSQLLEGLWGVGYKAVASCDFEVDLPRSGGYKAQI